MIAIKYNGKYIPIEAVVDCFEIGKHNFVDKSFTGNGFTSSFLQINPTHQHQSNLIIVPNREVILSKRAKYRADNDINKIKIGFIFGDSDSDKISFKDFDVMMFVVDSFVLRIDYLKKYSGCVDKILIDEMHSMYIQSEFRKKLKFFDELLSDNFRDKGIVSVTATPMLFQSNSIDISIVKEVSKFRSINITQNQKKSLERLKEKIKANEKIIVATHNARLIASLKDKNNVLKANFLIGKSLKQSLVERCIMQQDDESNLTILSSTAFEGYDCENGVYSIFIYEDRSQDFSSFYFQNIIQIIGRSRQGTDYIEYCRNTHSKGRKYFDLEEMNKVVNSTRISFEKKMVGKEYKYIPRFYYPLLEKENKGFIKDLVLDDISYNLYSENQKFDDNGCAMYKEYAEKRGFKLIEINEGVNRVDFGTLKTISKFKYLSKNKEYILRNDVFSDIKINLLPKENVDDYIKEYEKYFRRKYALYIDDYLLEKFQLTDFIEIVSTRKEWQVYNTLLSGKERYKKDNRIMQLVSLYSSKYRKKKLAEYKGNHKDEKFKKEIAEFKKGIEERILRLLLSFSQDLVKVPSKKRVWRDYNLFTELSLFIAEDLAKAFDIDINEIDIRTCNPRVIYAYLGLILPEGFYGVNKKNKKDINILLNSLSKEYAESKGINLKKRKQTILRDLHKYNFDEKVIEFLRTFWNKPKDSLFNWCAYHEKEIINLLKSKLMDVYGKDRFSFMRRHDSILMIGKDAEMYSSDAEDILKDFTYLGIKGWFVEAPEEGVKLTEENVAEIKMLFDELAPF